MAAAGGRAGSAGWPFVVEGVRSGWVPHAVDGYAGTLVRIHLAWVLWLPWTLAWLWDWGSGLEGLGGSGVSG